MLDVITDFWKPVKKSAAVDAPDVTSLRLGSAIAFGTVPQGLLSGNRFRVAGVNTYQFGDERMTSFVLSGATEDNVSLIIASADGEPYLAISRRVPLADRMRMFDPTELEAVAEQPEAARLVCREVDAKWQHWIVSNYKKEINGLRGSMMKGDARFAPASAAPEPFDYVLLTSDSNEYAVEIERYTDGRIEVYATVYRRVTDIVEIEPAQGAQLEVVKPLEAPRREPEIKTEAKEEVKTEAKPEIKPEALTPPKAEAPKPEAQKPAPTKPAPSFPLFTPSTTSLTKTQENQPMPQPNGATNRQEIKPVNIRNSTEVENNENDAIECDLRAANKIIEEAIRNEMRLSDVVRRIIALPVANPDSVQIPIQLGDADFQLLAIRYGLPAADRNAIKNRIIEEINEFSGNKE